ncbi:MAG: WG repeat-containing protein [Aureispira sp.]
MPLLFSLLLGLLLSYSSFAQENSIEPTPEQLYSINGFHLEQLKFLGTVYAPFLPLHLPPNSAVVPFRKDKKWGLVAPNAPKDEWIVPPSFDQITGVYEAGAIVVTIQNAEEGAYNFGLIGVDGQVLIPVEYRSLTREGNLFHGLKTLEKTTLENGTLLPPATEFPTNAPACYQHDYYDMQGKLVFSEKSVDFFSFGTNNSLAWFRMGKTITIRDQKGKVVATHQTDAPNKAFLGIGGDLLNFLVLDGNDVVIQSCTAAGEVQYQCFQVRLEEEDKPNFKIPYTYNHGQAACYQISEQLYATETVGMNEEYTVNFAHIDQVQHFDAYFYDYDKAGLSVPKGYYKKEKFLVGPLGELAEGTEYNATYYIDRQGKKLSHPKHKLYQSEGFSFLKYEQDQHSLFLTEKGEVVKFHNVLVTAEDRSARILYPKGKFGFYEGWCTAMKRCNDADEQPAACYYYIDKTGKTVLELPHTITAIGPFSEGLAPAFSEEGKFGFINKQGAWVVQPIYSRAQGYKQRKFAFPSFKNGYIYLPELGYINKEGKEFFTRD